MLNRLKELREKAGLTQERLAELSNTSLQQISRLERGERRLSTHWLLRLAAPLGVRPEEIISDFGIVQTDTEVPGDIADEIDEIELLKLYRKLDFRGRAALLLLLKTATANLPGKADIA